MLQEPPNADVSGHMSIESIDNRSLHGGADNVCRCERFRMLRSDVCSLPIGK